MMETTTRQSSGKPNGENSAEIAVRARGLTGIYAVDLTLRHAWKVIVGVAGATIVLFGVTLLFIPGPGIVFIGLGLGVLATEFVWARLWLKRLKRAAVDTARAVTGGNKSPESRDS